MKYRTEEQTINVEILETGWGWWPIFKPSHYLDSGPMPYSSAYVGFVNGEPVVHLGISGHVSGRRREARACRMVVMPEWQGAGIGMRFLNLMCQREWEGRGFIGQPVTTLFHTAHPGLVAGLRRDPHWDQVSAATGGAGYKKDAGWGAHFRTVTGWRYYGEGE